MRTPLLLLALLLASCASEIDGMQSSDSDCRPTGCGTSDECYDPHGLVCGHVVCSDGQAPATQCGTFNENGEQRFDYASHSGALCSGVCR